MDHNEAVETLAAERYLLSEMDDAGREAFEAHVFDCPECALDLRAGGMFVQESRAQLPAMVKSVAAAPESGAKSSFGKSSFMDQWFGWMTPAIAAPAFAALLLAVGYQNLVTFPALRAAVSKPRVSMAFALHGDTRGVDAMQVIADRNGGLTLSLDRPESQGASSLALELYGPDKSLLWSGVADAASAADADQPIALAIPARLLQEGKFRLQVSGVGADGSRRVLESFSLDVHFSAQEK